MATENASFRRVRSKVAKLSCTIFHAKTGVGVPASASGKIRTMAQQKIISYFRGTAVARLFASILLNGVWRVARFPSTVASCPSRSTINVSEKTSKTELKPDEPQSLRPMNMHTLL
mmetsp:Transcript_12206/g.20228  ORF Transcript_12206/g.20228 Transcript_12206/m.20228 type:complete len:116 (+) Transcript_12206:327-674(+)